MKFKVGDELIGPGGLIAHVLEIGKMKEAGEDVYKLRFFPSQRLDGKVFPIKEVEARFRLKGKI